MPKHCRLSMAEQAHSRLLNALLETVVPIYALIPCLQFSYGEYAPRYRVFFLLGVRGYFLIDEAVDVDLWFIFVLGCNSGKQFYIFYSSEACPHFIIVFALYLSKHGMVRLAFSLKHRDVVRFSLGSVFRRPLGTFSWA